MMPHCLKDLIIAAAISIKASGDFQEQQTSFIRINQDVAIH